MSIEAKSGCAVRAVRYGKCPEKTFFSESYTKQTARTAQAASDH